MKFHFDANQEYQLQAIKAIVDIFEGQPLSKGDFEFSLGQEQGSLQFGENGVGNNILLSEDQILANLNAVQDRNGLFKTSKLEGMNFSLEMETGTGKTYVYLRTIYELNKRYGFKKFVIVVPSVAIREGVLKNLEVTFEHFQGLYEKVPATYQVYDAGKVSGLRNFAQSNAIQILVINIDSFAKDINIINKTNDKLTGKRPIEFIQSAKPIVIVDEPQNMETDARKAAVANLNPSCTLRYSATHTNLYNLVYRLDPVKAYDLGLVKQIEVDSVFAENDYNRAFIRLESVKSAKTRTSAKIKIDTNTDKGVVKKSVTAEVGDDIYELSCKREIYRDGFIINAIDVENKCIELSNGDTLLVGDTRGGLNDQIMKVQVSKAIEEHLKKEKELKRLGIKVLTLFFIDRVSNYRVYDESGNPQKGKFAEWFETLYAALSARPAYAGTISFKAEDLHNGYFAQDKKGIFRDSSEKRETQADDDIYHLIMRDKEKLLDINNPLRFIFSHSALREGWDNPNVFQICTLNETKSEMKKRQEIGRGLRLPVDQTGNRIYDKNINRLTVIANESYEEFAAKLQKEIQEDCGVEFTGRIKNKGNRVRVRLKKGYRLDANFLDLWSRIKHKTTYRVAYDTKDLIRDAAKAIKQMPDVPKAVIKSVRTAVEMMDKGITGSQKSVSIQQVEVTGNDIPDILGYIQGKTELTRSTILAILKESGRISEALKNPQLFLDMVVAEIKNILNRLMIDGIKYEKIAGHEYAMMLFDDHEIESYKENLYKVTKEDKTIADHIIIDAMSEPEKQFAKDCESNENVEFYIKLPEWFKIKTPIGSYNPDWALIFKNEKKLYFVAETKSTLEQTGLRDMERMKIRCGKAHFQEFADVEFKTVRAVADLV